MSIFIDRDTPVLIQGMTGKEGAFWSKHMIELGTDVVAGVTPGKAGETVHGCPVYNSVRDAMAEHTIKASMLFVPPRMAYDAVMEALDGGIKKIVMVAEGVPLREMLLLRQACKERDALLIGGNTSGVITPKEAMMGIFPHWIERVYRRGSIGVMTRSGSLTNEVTSMVVKSGYGVSTLVGIGGDPVPGTRFAEMLPHYEKDPETKAVLIIGEIGGTMEEEVAEVLASGEFTKPLVAFLAGRTAPTGQKMGHAGAIITGGKGSVEDKAKALEAAGAKVANRPREVGALLESLGVEKDPD